METTPLISASTPPRIEPTRVSTDVYTYTPDPAGKASLGNADPTAPQLIILFGWLDGRLSSVAKYMDGYRQLYPHAHQVLITSRKESAWTRKSKNLDYVRPAVDLIRSHGLFSAAPPNVLVHVLSNGGGFQLLLLSELLNAIPRGPPPARAPTTALVFDSVPGEAGLAHALRAHTIALRSRLLRLLVSGPLILLYALVMGAAFLRRRPSPFAVLRAGLQRPVLVPGMTTRTPRLYVYSREDMMVQAASVEKHIAEARERGLSVEGARFSGSAHVAHLRADPVRYWDVIARHWESAVGAVGA